MEKYRPTDPLKNLGHTEHQIPGQFELQKLFSVRWSVQSKQNYRKKRTANILLE